MDIQASIQWITNELNALRDPQIINEFMTTLKNRKQQDIDWWDEISEEEKSEIEEGIKQAEKCEFISHEEVMANPRKWL